MKKQQSPLLGNCAKLKRYRTSGVLLMLAGMLGSSAHAQLLHRYDFTSANDTVGTANGTLVNGAVLNGGALVTDGGNGATNGTWTGTGQRMTLDPSAVSGITGAFTIESWFSCSTGWPKYDSLYAFSDGTQNNYLLGVPVRGYSPWPSGVGIKGAGGSTADQPVVGIYLDDKATHQTVLTYDGTNFTYYIDGAIANYGGSATLTDPGFNLSTLTDIGINGGSPWNDPTLTGSTYDFRIYGQALTGAQVGNIFALGKDASNSAISNALLPPSAFVWNGGSANDNWSTGLNWLGGTAPAASGNSVTFAGSTRTTPNLDANYSVTGLTFSNNASSFTLGTTSGSTLTLAGAVVNNSANGQTFNVPLALGFPAALNAASGNLVVNSNITLGANALTMMGNNSFTLNGNVTGTGTFTKSGAGSLTLGGNVSAGTVSFNDGTTVISTVVSGSSGNPAYVGYTSGKGVLNLQNGTLNIGGDLRVGGSDVNGTAANGTGTFTLSGGTANLGSLTVARGNNVENSVAGTVTLNSGSTLVSTNDVTLGFAGSGLGKVVINGGTFVIGPAATKWFMVGFYDSASGEVDINSGNLFLENNTSIKMSRSTTTGANVINQNGGSVTFYSDAGVTVGGTGNLDLNQGGNSTSTDTYNLNGGTLTVPQIRASASGGNTTFNFNGGTLKAAASSTTFMQGLATANVMAGGAIIDTAGRDITIAQALNNGGGGLTKLGAGTLTLSGGYTYTGPTVVQAGTLAVDTTQGSSGSDLSVTNAALTVLLNNGLSTLYAGKLAFAGSSVLNLNYGTATMPTTALSATTVSASGTTVINISGAYLVVGQYPLIYSASGSVPTTGFSLGTLPAGVVAHLASSANSLDLVITAAGQTLTWYGANSVGSPLTTWDINSSANWNYGSSKYLQYSGNSYGDNVIFDDTLANPSAGNVTLNTTVVPLSVNFNNSATPYSLTGSGGIGGAASVVLGGSSSVFLGTSNSYTGGTVIGTGILTVVNDHALGASNAPVSLGGGTLQFSNSTASARSITVVSNSTIDLPANANVQLSGAVSGNGTLTKTGLGTLTMAGADSAASTLVGAGVLNLTGNATNKTVTVGNAAGNAVMGISGSLVASNLFVGNVSGAVAAAYQNGGTVSLNGGTGDNLSIGNWDGSFGYFNISGGSMNVNGINIGGEENPNVWPPVGGGDGIMEVNAATVNNSGWIVLARGGGPNTGILNVYSGAFTYSGGGLGCNWNGNAATVTGTQTAIINVLGGAVTSTNQGVNFRSSGNIGIVNLNGGLLSGTGVSGYGTLNFNGGTLQASAPVAAPFVNVNSNAYVYSGGAKIDDNGQAVTVSQPLLAPTGSGVSGPVAISNPGAGYIAPPIVTISGDGTGATAIAQIDRNAGTVTNVIITCPGINYTTATFTFSGGGATSQASASASLAVNVSGGLTKLGNGTLTLDGVNTYTGPTVVNAGTLAGKGVLAGALANNATLAPGDAGVGALTVNGDLTLNPGSTNVFAVNGTTLANSSVIAGGKVTYGGVLKIVPSGTLTTGQQFVLFSGTGATSASNFTSVQSTASGVAFSFTNGVLTVIPGVASNPTNITAVVSGHTLSLSWPADHLGWLVQSNSVNVADPNSWFTIPGSDSVNSLNVTIDAAQPKVFYRLRKP